MMSGEEFLTEFEARVIALVVPADAAIADKVAVEIVNEASVDEGWDTGPSADPYITAAVTGQDQTGRFLWRYDRVFEGPAAFRDLLAALVKAEPGDRGEDLLPHEHGAGLFRGFRPEVSAADELTQLGQEINPEGYR